jgi:hypothetical protein
VLAISGRHIAEAGQTTVVDGPIAVVFADQAAGSEAGSAGPALPTCASGPVHAFTGMPIASDGSLADNPGLYDESRHRLYRRAIAKLTGS